MANDSMSSQASWCLTLIVLAAFENTAKLESRALRTLFWGSFSFRVGRFCDVHFTPSFFLIFILSESR